MTRDFMQSSSMRKRVVATVTLTVLIVVAFLAISGFLIVSCARNHYRNAYYEIYMGMTLDRVIELVGSEPNYDNLGKKYPLQVLHRDVERTLIASESNIGDARVFRRFSWINEWYELTVYIGDDGTVISRSITSLSFPQSTH